MYYSQDARLAIYAEAEFGKTSKTAEGVIRYGKNPIVAVIDSTNAGKRVSDITGIASDAPIVASIEESLKHRTDALLLGTAWTGGALPPQWKPDILLAINSGLDIINGLHDFLGDDVEIAQAANQKQKQLFDVRRPPTDLPVASGQVLNIPSYVVLTVGSDCSVGKMTVSLELAKVAEKRQRSAKFIATGQTGIMICGEGIAIDRVIGDFMAGATEMMVVQAAEHEFIFVEGQGSIVHPGFSGVTLALLHGAAPQALVLVHNPSRSKIKNTDFPIPDYATLIKMYEELSSFIRPAKVVGIALNTRGMSEAEAQLALKKAEAQTGLPATDAVRYGADRLFDAIISHKEKGIELGHH